MAKAGDKKESREDRIKRICGSINNGSFGGEKKDAVTYLGSKEAISLERFSSGCPDLDKALGGGWPKGRFVELYGSESGGKTTLALHAIAEHQKKYPDEDCALIDTEYAFDEEYARAIGVDTRYLIVNQPESGEQALNVLSQLINEGVGVAIVDSVAALTTRGELEGNIGDTKVAEQARLMSGALRRLTMEAGRKGATVFWTNQVREKIGVMFGDKTTTPAGRALKHYASVRVNITRIGSEKEKVDGETIIVSNKVRADVKKNKTAAPFKKAEFFITFGTGIDFAAALLDSALNAGVVNRKGARFTIGDDIIGNGRANVLESMKDPESLVGSQVEAAMAEYYKDQRDKAVVEKAEAKVKSAGLTDPDGPLADDGGDDVVEKEV